MGLTRSRFIPEYGKPELQNDDYQFNDETTENSRIESRCLTRNHRSRVAIVRPNIDDDYINQLLKRKWMTIHAKTLECETVTVTHVSRLDLVCDVKDTIATRLRRNNPDEITLLHEHKEMKGFKTLGSYGITDGTTINVIPHIQGKDYLIPNETTENSRIESRPLTRSHMPREAIDRHNIYDDYINYLKKKWMTIHAKTLEGDTVTVTDVSRLDLVRDVKDKVATRLRRKNPDKIILLHQQEEMMDFKTLESYGITDGTTINVIPRIPGKGCFEHANFAYDQAKEKVKRFGYVYKAHSFGGYVYTAHLFRAACFSWILTMMFTISAMLNVALDLRHLHPGVQNIWKLYRGCLESSKVALDLVNDMLSRLGVQNIGTFYKDLLESLKVVWVEMKNMLKSLEKWVPDLFANFKRALTKLELVNISQQIGNGWEILGRTLGIDGVKLDHIKADNPTMAMQILQMLTTWAEDIESEATVGKLYTAMEGCQSLNFNKEQIKLILSGAPLDI